MPTLMDYEIEGAVQNGNKLDFAKEKLAVHAFVKGKEVAQADVDTSGHYKLTFRYGEDRPATELRVTPAEIQNAAIAAADALTPAEYRTKGDKATAHLDFKVPSADDKVLPPLAKLVWGGVGSLEMHPQGAGDIDPMPGAKMDFSLDTPYWVLRWEPGPRPGLPMMHRWVLQIDRRILGYTYTQPLQPGATTFLSPYSFKVPLVPSAGHIPAVPSGYQIPVPPPLPPATLRVSISQFVNGNWNQVLFVGIAWNEIPPNGELDFFVPADKVVPQPSVGTLPHSIGLLPCDGRHLVKGYAYGQTGDPDRIQGVSHQPFCDTLRIFGLFPRTPQVATYRVQIAATNENYLPGVTTNLSWEELTDPLINLQRDPVTQDYTAKPLGPFPKADGTMYYKNIDTEPEARWMEHTLKFTWNSRNKVDGFYALRLLGFDQNNNQIGEFNLPVMRVDNTIPEAALDAVNAGKCGQVMLSQDGKLNFNVTAYDPAGHVLSYGLSATAGKAALGLKTGMESVAVNGVGFKVQAEAITIQNLDPTLQDCDPLAYNFTLYVQGSAMDGYSTTVSSQLVIKEADLIVAKFKPLPLQ